jgi:CheY-like chemotaxis protein
MKTILIVADDTVLLTAWNGILHQDGFRVVSARNGLQGLVVARIEKPALIITDRTMPLMDGVEFCRHLRSNPALARIPLVLASAESIEPCKRGRWDEFWLKPVSAESLRASVQRLLSAGHASD